MLSHIHPEGMSQEAQDHSKRAIGLLASGFGTLQKLEAVEPLSLNFWKKKSGGCVVLHYSHFLGSS